MADSIDLTLGGVTDVVISGGPATVNVEVDFGPVGERGSKIFVGFGNPNSSSVTLPEAPIALDTFINIGQFDEDSEYLSMYQYVMENGSMTWKYAVSLIPSIFSDNYTTTFVDGDGSVNIPLNSFVPSTILSTVDSDNFNTQITINNSSPVSFGVSAGSIATNGNIRTLTLDISAVELVSGEWIPLDGQKIVQAFITMV
jgi:hypothetical protein